VFLPAVKINAFVSSATSNLLHERTITRTTNNNSNSNKNNCNTTPLLASKSSNVDNLDIETIGRRMADEFQELSDCAGIIFSSLFSDSKSSSSGGGGGGSSNSAAVQEALVRLCDSLDDLPSADSNNLLLTSKMLQLRKKAMEFQRYELLVHLMKSDYDDYVATASFLSPSRIPRRMLPNVQDVPYNVNSDDDDDVIAQKSRQTTAITQPTSTTSTNIDDQGQALVADCELQDKQFKDSLLDKLLLKIFRSLVEKNTGGIQSEKPGIDGLLEQGRTFMLQEGQTPEAQHKMVADTLKGLMTPVLPPFYRFFMSGIVPKLGTDYDGKQIGPWFYAPFLTSVVTPTFFAFLVGPSYPNRRRDGQPGGLVVEKCKFLQESGCKGLCLHQCKLPAQQFFQNELGLALTVSPNFVTQECQWSFGEEPMLPSEDPSFPKGCLVGCESRKAMAGRVADICN